MLSLTFIRRSLLPTCLHSFLSQVQNTANRKFFTSVPAVLFLLAAHSNKYSANIVYLNFSEALPLIVAKFPGMHGVRIFGINSGPP